MSHPNNHDGNRNQRAYVFQIGPSNRDDKKLMVRTPTGKTHHFGDPKEGDYTTTHDEERKEKYMKRHHAEELWRNWDSPKFWNYYLLWNKPTVEESIQDVESQFGFKIVSLPST